MIKRVLILGAGAAAGWLGHTVFTRGRDTAALRAEQTLRTTLHPEHLGRQAGQATASALAAGARGFAEQLRAEVPAWRTVGAPPSGPAVETEPAERAAGLPPEPPIPEAARSTARRERTQAELRRIAAATDWRAVADAATTQGWRGAATAVIRSGLSADRTTTWDRRSGDVIPGTVSDPLWESQTSDPADRADPADRRQS